jgi:hypothetical protein
MFGLETQMAGDCDPITIAPPSALRDALTALGENSKLVILKSVSRFRD